MNAYKLRSRRRKSIAGFTLIEMLVVIIIVGVLFAIAAPSWTALMNRQRINTIREQSVQVLREAQNQARTTRIGRFAVFDGDGITTPARAAIVPQASGKAFPDITTINNWRTLGDGEVKVGVMEFKAASPSDATTTYILFDNKGAVDRDWIKPGTNLLSQFVIKVKPKGAGVETQRCAIVETLLGSVRLAEGTQNGCNS